MIHTQAPPSDADGRRLGGFGGVFTPSILTILGVVMYMLFGRVVGNVGLGGALLIVLISHLISVSTGLSVSSIATNRTVGAGGAYYMISRSLGAPAGAAVGLPLFFAQALSVSFYIVGFTESVGFLARSLMGGGPLPFYLDPRIIGTLTLLLLTLISAKSAEAAIKAQYVVMAAILLSLVSFFAGRGAHPPASIQWWSSAGSFSETFALFFPAVTGIMAGVSMSGDLKDPRKALPTGTMSAIFVGFIIYMSFPFWLAVNASGEALLKNDYIVWEIAWIPALIYVGVWGATLSSAIGSILSAPRTLQALALDELAPKLFAKGHGGNNEPLRGLLFTFVLAELGVLLGDLELIAPILTMFFLATYGVTNLACALERWAASPSFRPTFKVSAWISLIGALACFYVMSIIDLLAMIVALLVCGVIYLWAERRDLNMTFGDARHGLWSALVRTALRHLHRAEFHPMNWRPNLLIFGGAPARRPHLLDLGVAMVQDRGIASYIQLIEGDIAAQAESRRAQSQRLAEILELDSPNVFSRVDVVAARYPGMAHVAQSYGIGHLHANTVLMGWMSKPERAAPYFKLLRDLSAMRRSIALLKYDNQRGFGRHRSIHVWWGGLQGNGGLMLLLAYLITSHPRWREAEVVALTVVDSDEDAARAEEGLYRVFESARLEAKARVIRREGRDMAALMAAESGEADLTLLGLRLPNNPEDVEALHAQYTRFLSGLSSALLIHSGPDFDTAPVLFDA
ncbi:Na-K-Cl cotransporter [Myxococcota bacterium]|nr:Na-K-Cl cotransporter [Myxococcota bacterium]